MGQPLLQLHDKNDAAISSTNKKPELLCIACSRLALGDGL